MRELFADLPVKLAFSSHDDAARVPLARTPSQDFFRGNYGPTMRAREALEASGRWTQLDADVRALAARFYRDGAVEYAVLGDHRGSWSS